MDRPRLEFVFPAAHNPGREARQRIGDFVRHRGFTERDVQTVELVASELICNAIDHGGGGGANEVEELKEQVEVTVSLELSDESWSLAVTDQGGGDPKLLRTLAHPEQVPDLEDERGRGMYLLAQMVDSLEIERAEGGLRLRATCALGREA